VGQGIDAYSSARHLIRNVSGQPLRRGVFVDEIYDVGRIENVHFNPWWSMEPALLAWQQANGEGVQSRSCARVTRIDSEAAVSLTTDATIPPRARIWHSVTNRS
jgi:hypothetical protein